MTVDLQSTEQVDRLLTDIAAGAELDQLVPIRAHVRIVAEPPDNSVSVDADGDLWYRDGATMNIIAWRIGRGASWSQSIVDVLEFGPFLVIWPLLPREDTP